MRYYTSTRLGVFKRIFVWVMMVQIMSWQLLPGVMAIAEAAEGPDDALGGLTVGGQFGEEEFQAFGDILLPVLYGDDMGLLFVSPRLSVTDHEEEELNLGLGYRYLLNVSGYDVIMGANAYYDNRWTHYNNHFDQYGVGLEVLTPWVDARANWYFADEDEELVNSYTETSTTTAQDWQDLYATGNSIRQQLVTTTTTETRTYEQYEASVDGFDAEIGVRLPYIDQWVDARVFVGWQDFDNPYGDDFEGAKGRLEVRALPGLTLDAEVYEDEDLNGTEYTVGARLRVPFDLAQLVRGGNPFTGATEAFEYAGKVPFSARMGEMVMRDMKVRRSQSDLTENLDKRVVEKDVVWSEETLTDTATFVDGDNAGGFQNGTYEHPWDMIQKGVSNAFGDGIVVVDEYDSAPAYSENVVIADNVHVYGRYPGMGGKYFGGDRPKVDGGLPGNDLPTFRMGNHTTLAGFRVMNSGANGPGYVVDGLNAGNAGVVSEDKSGLLLSDLVVTVNGYGGLLNQTLGDLVARVEDSHFINNGTYGLYVRGTGASGDFDLAIEHSNFNGNSSEGIRAQATNYDDVRITLSGVEANENGSGGIRIRSFQYYAFDNATITLSGVEANGNTWGSGIDMITSLYGGYGNLTVALNGVRANGNDYYGINVSAFQDHGDVLVSLSSIQANGNGLYYGTESGIKARAIGHYGSGTVVGNNIEANRNGFYGARIFAYGWHNGSAHLTLSNVTASDNNTPGSGGLYAHTEADNGGDSVISLSYITAHSNYAYNIRANARAHNGGTGDAVITLTDIRATGSLLNGDVRTDAYSYGGNATITMSGSGVAALIHATATASLGGSGDAEISLTDIRANNSAYGSGIYATTFSYAGDATITMTDVKANGNSSANIWVRARTGNGGTGDAMVSLTDVEANNSTFGVGIVAGVYSQAGDSTLTMTDVVATGNYWDGVRMNLTGGYVDAVLNNCVMTGNGDDGLEVTVADGDAAPDTVIRNSSLFGNASADLRNNGAEQVDARQNWWGTATPGPGQFAGAGGGVDYSSPLGSDPN